MQAHLLIGAGAGLVSAALFASAAVSPALAGFLLYLAPLPLCLAGLGWGRIAVLLAGATATVAMALALGPGAFVYAASIAAPIAFLIHLLLLSRPAEPGAEANQALEWYPAGRLVGVAALIAGALAGLMVLLLGPDAESYRATIDSLFPHLQKTLDPDDTVFTPETAENLKAVLGKALPAAFAIFWLTVVLFNLWLAGYVVNASGHPLRPWPDIHGLEVPNLYVVVFAVAIVASFLPGIVGLLATAFAVALLFAYVLQGLAVIHVYSQGVPFRPALLAVVYLAILFLGWPAIVVAILGLGEPLFGLRARGAARTPPDNDSND